MSLVQSRNRIAARTVGTSGRADGVLSQVAVVCLAGKILFLWSLTAADCSPEGFVLANGTALRATYDVSK